MEPCDDELTPETPDAEPQRVPLGQRPEPRWAGWTARWLANFTVFFAVLAFLLVIIWVAPTSKSNADASRSNADAVKSLAAATAVEKQQSACYDLFSARVTDGNSAAFAAALGLLGAIGTLVVDLSTPAPQRDPAVVPADVEAIKAASQHGADALAAYNQANDARTAYAAAGRPLPCPISR